jgi:PAS domain S-box-containing protein
VEGIEHFVSLARETIKAVSFALQAEVIVIDKDLNFLVGSEKSPSANSRIEKAILESKGFCKLGDISSPIVIEEKTIGWILVYLNTSEKQPDYQKQQAYLNWVGRFLSKAMEGNFSIDRSEMLARILDAVHEGVMVIDRSSQVIYYNVKAEQLIKFPSSKIIGQSLASIWPGAPALQAAKNGLEYTEKEEIYQIGERWMHFIVSIRLLSGTEDHEGVVISFRDISEARRLIYNLSQSSPAHSFKDIIGNSLIIRKIKEQALRVAKSNSTVLITGESGTGKEIFARAIHFASLRSKGPFISLNCGAIPENLLESELFGYEGGAFTGALKEGKVGKFEIADGGTVFLDEIGEMPLHLQVKLLHVLQNREVERVGGSQKIPVDIRIVAASNRDLDVMMQERKFRKDLYFRLGVIPLHIAPLRERKEDIPQLTEFFLAKLAGRMNRPIMTVSSEVLEMFLSYQWPGNIRELENTLEYAVNMCNGNMLIPANIPQRVNKPVQEQTECNSNLKTLLVNYERKVIEEHLRRFGTSSKEKNRVAKVLGVSRSTLYRRISELNIAAE